MMRNFYHRGITVVEVLMVIAVLVIIFAIVIPQFSRLRENQVLKSAVSDILSTIYKAQSQTLASKNSYAYGVHVQSDRVIIYRGTVYSAGDANNETVSITSPASVMNVTFGGVSGASGDVYFNRLSGAPSTTGTITIGTGSYSKIITIYATGVASMN